MNLSISLISSSDPVESDTISSSAYDRETTVAIAKEQDAVDVGLQQAATFINISNTKILRQNIYLSIDERFPSFESQVRSALDSLEQIEIGKRLIEKIAGASHKIFIKQGKGFYCCKENGDAEISGKGCRSLIIFPDLDPIENRTYYTAQLSLALKPGFVDFAHELIHAYHNSKGKNAKDIFRCDTLVWIRDEEYHTIMGFPSKKINRKTPKITENAILAAIGLPERFGYVSSSSIKPVLYQRMKLVSQLYNRFCLETRYEGQSKNPPPPIINCDYKDLSHSTRVMLFYRVKKQGNSTEDVLILNTINSKPPSENFVKQEFNGEQCPVEWKLQNLSPSNADKKIISVGFYRLSSLEADALDISMGLN